MAGIVMACELLDRPRLPALRLQREKETAIDRLFLKREYKVRGHGPTAGKVVPMDEGPWT